MKKDLKERCGTIVAVKMLVDRLLIELVRQGGMTVTEAGGVIWDTHQAVEGRKGTLQDDDEILGHALRALEASAATLMANAGPQSIGRA